jgi:RND family efflux transporter MFP subunit
MKFKISTKYILPTIAAILLIVTLKRIFFQVENKAITPMVEPISTTFAQRIAGIGIVESVSESIGISPIVPGVVKKVLVLAGQQVKAGDGLFVIDSSMLNAQIASAQVALEQAQHNFNFYKKAGEAVSKEDLLNREFDFKAAKSKLDELKTNLDLCTVRAPVDATILKVNVRVGEYAPSAVLSTPLMVIGDQSVMHVRVEIDETDVQRLKYQKSAYGSLRSGSKQVDLKFVRAESLIKEKRSLVNDATERVDSRVLEAIYSFNNEDLEAVSGQQMDVYIELADK